MIVYNIDSGQAYQCQPHPMRKGEFLIPSGTTSEPPPAFDVSTQVCVFENNSWVVSDITVEEVENSPEIETPTAIELLRYERNFRLSQSDWRMLPDYSGTDQTEWIEYRKQLKNIPQRVESGELPKPTMNENYELVFEHWPEEPA